ncbi:MAG: chloride channel protein [Acidimicrobiia bacterium]
MGERLRTSAVEILTDRETTTFLALSALVGLGVGVGAAALVTVIGLIADGFLQVEEFAGGSRWWVFVAVPLGLYLAWWLAKRFAPEVEGDGVPDAIAALAIHGGMIRGRVTPVKIVATSLTLGGGGSGGREGPIVQIGSSIGSVIARFFHLGEDQIKSLVAAGAAAGIGASFNAPIAGMLFALEVIIGSFAVRHVSAIVIASVVAAITSRSIVGEGLSIQAGSYGLDDPRQLFAYLILSFLAAFAGLAVLRGMDWLDTWQRKRNLRGWRPILFGLVVASIGFFESDILGTGQPFVSQLLQQSELFDRAGAGGNVWWTLALLSVAKLVATCFTTTSGAAGGAFMPSLFIGATLGASLGELLAPLDFLGGLRPGALAVVGMATVIAAVARAPLTAIMLVFEITGARDYGLILPLMLGTTMATFLADRFHPDSLYLSVLRRRGISLVPHSEIDLLDTVNVGDVMHRPHAVARLHQQLAEVESTMSRFRYNGLVVLEGPKVVGMLTVADISRAGGSSVRATVSQAMTARPVTVTPSTPVSSALERMAALGIGRLPVVAEDGSGTFVGLFRREEAVRAYHRALSQRTERELVRRRLDQRTDPGAGYFDFRVPPGSIADGKLVREVAWPEGSTLVSVSRSREVIVPTGGTTLLANDVVTAFGTPASRSEMIERLNAGASEATAEILVEDIAASDPPESDSRTVPP